MMGRFPLLLLLAVAAVLQPAPGAAHDGYQNWINRMGIGCCNDRDCRPVAAEHLRTIGGQLYLFVEGVGPAAGTSEWCQVEPRHYLRSGNAPDPSTAHACISAHYGADRPCQQFICFQPATQF